MRITLPIDLLAKGASGSQPLKGPWCSFCGCACRCLCSLLQHLDLTHDTSTHHHAGGVVEAPAPPPPHSFSIDQTPLRSPGTARTPKVKS